MSFLTGAVGGSFGANSIKPHFNPHLMRRYIVLLLGSFSLLLATACSRPDPVLRRSEPAVALFPFSLERPAVVDSCTDAPTPQQVKADQVATRSEELVAPRPRFYTRWRRVHGRWYHFTYRVGEKKRAMVIDPDPSRQSRQVA